MPASMRRARSPSRATPSGGAIETFSTSPRRSRAFAGWFAVSTGTRAVSSKANSPFRSMPAPAAAAGCWPRHSRPMARCWKPPRREIGSPASRPHAAGTAAVQNRSDRGVAAVHQKITAGDKAGGVAGEKDGGAGDLVGAAEPARQVLGAELLARGGKRTVAVEGPLRLDPTRRQRVGPDVLRGMVDRDDLGELDQRTFGRAIGGAPGAADPAQLRGDKDDRSTAAGDHQRQRGAAQ